MPTWTYIALGFMPGVIAGMWLANHECQKRLRSLREEMNNDRRRVAFWRERWVDIVRRLDEQDVRK